jgi:hypothetical protein
VQERARGGRGVVHITKEMLRQAFGGKYRTLREVGEELGIGRERVRQLIKQYGIEVPPRVGGPGRRRKESGRTDGSN